MTPQFLADTLPSQNPNSGRSRTLAAKVPPELLDAIVQITESKNSPYDSVSAFVRAAVHRLVLETAEASGAVQPSVIALLKDWARRYFVFHCHEQVVAETEHNAKMLEKYVEYGDSDKAIETLEDVATDVMGLDDPFWQKACLKELFKFEIVAEVMEMAEGRAPVAATAYDAWKGIDGES